MQPATVLDGDEVRHLSTNQILGIQAEYALRRGRQVQQAAVVAGDGDDVR